MMMLLAVKNFSRVSQKTDDIATYLMIRERHYFQRDAMRADYLSRSRATIYATDEIVHGLTHFKERKNFKNGARPNIDSSGRLEN